MKRQLYPSAQDVWSAYESILENECVVTETDKRALAAALRAAADQVVPETNYPVETAWQVGFADRDAQLRADLLAIAAELEAQ
jgi:hypothetical protein